MNQKANEVSSSQITIFVISSQISFGILSLASTLAKEIGHDGWMSALLGGLLVCILIYLMVALLKRFNNLSILEINTYLFGKIIGTFLNLLIVGYLMYFTVLALRRFTDIINISVLKSTPGLVLSCFIIIPIIYLSWYGLKYLCRYSVFKVVLLIIIILYYFLLSKNFRMTFLQPFMENGLMPILKGAYIPYFSYLGFELITIIYPNIKDKKSTFRYTIYGNLVTMAFYLITVIFLTGFFGEVMLEQLQYPIFSLARAYRAPILERLDLFFIALWFPVMGGVLQFYYFCTYHSLKKIFKIENDKKKCKILISCVTAVVIALSRIPKDMIQMDKLFDILGYIGTVYVGHLLICYIISFIKKPGGKQHEKSV